MSEDLPENKKTGMGDSLRDLTWGISLASNSYTYTITWPCSRRDWYIIKV